MSNPVLCAPPWVTLPQLETAMQPFRKIRKAVEVLVAPDERRRDFLRLTGNVTKAYKALLPDERASPFLRRVAVLHVVAQAVKAKLGPSDIAKLSARIAELLDEKIEGVAILAPIVEGDGKEGRVDLSEIDFEKLGELFAESPKVTAERLREEAEGRAKAMAARNPTRKPLVEKLEQLVAAYNAAIMGTEEYFEALQALIRSLDEEEARVAREGLDNEEQLAIFDLLTKPEPKLTKAQEIEVKAVARRLLDRLHELIDAVDWQRGQETRGAVWTELRMQLNALPEEPYPEPIWNAKVGEVWDFVLQRYQ